MYLPEISVAEIRESENDEQWAQLRAAAVTLAEATNALIVPGRYAAPPGTVSANPDSELDPAKIEALFANERPSAVLVPRAAIA